MTQPAAQKTASERACGVCGATTFEASCRLTASGKHWISMTDDDSPMPAVLAAALTAPEHRTPEQHELMQRST